MRAYSTTEFRAHLAEALNDAKKDGVIKIYNKKGDEFTITPVKKASSPFEKVNTIDLTSVNESEILTAIAESRKQY